MRVLQVARKPRQTALLLYFQGCKCAGFKYFRPVIDELRVHPAPEGYLDYLRLKLRQAAAALPTNVQKSTFSDDR